MRAQIPLNFLISILIAVIILVPVTVLIGKCTRLTDQGEQSYENFVTKISELKDGEITALTLYMDKNTRVVVFENSAKKVEYKVGVKTTLSCEKDWEVFRPKNCEEGVTCICRCK